MNRPRKPDRSGEFRPRRILATTAFIAVIFSVGLIVGQHLLFEDSLPPVVSTTADASPSQAAATAEQPGDGEPNLFSFYDVLTAAEIDDEAPQLSGDDVFAPVGGDDLPEADVGDPGADDPGSDPAFGIDDDQTPNTEDGSPPARYTLQVASHPSMEQARTEMDRLRAMELDPHVVAANVPGQGKYYRVRVGKFQNEDQARAFQARMQAAHSLRTLITPL